MSDLSGFNHGRRKMLQFSAAITLMGLSGCCSLFGGRKPTSEIPEEIPSDLRPILAPASIRKNSDVSQIIDVHAHFFNAKDVPVSGYLGGPVAHASKGVARKLLPLLARHAEWITKSAPSAREEFDKLIELSSQSSTNFLAMDAVQTAAFLDSERQSRISVLSERFYDEVKNNKPFVEGYNSALTEARANSDGQNFLGPDEFNESSLFYAMQYDVGLQNEDEHSFIGRSKPDYPDGVLAFVGCMLNYRWMNLRDYQKAFSTDPEAFGVAHVLGVLVDFDEWLCPPARTTQEDQIKLHQLISQLSGGYMRPVVAYNPWSAALDGGTGAENKILKRVLDALDNRGYVGVKIYPPNGFRPFGNDKPDFKKPNHHSPPGKKIDEVFSALWRECEKRGVPVMAHTGQTMGSNDAFNLMAEPAGWRYLIEEFESTPVRVNLGHFGGEDPDHKWSEEFINLMFAPGGKNIYADIGYWETKDCLETPGDCNFKKKLSDLFARYPDFQNRLMYGSDWHMLSKEPRWSLYPFKILNNLPAHFAKEKFFSGNALNCYLKLKNTL